MMRVHILEIIGHGIVLAARMAWKTGWSLVLGFAVSAVLQSIVTADALRERLGSSGARPVALATLAGAASSSCSYASASIMRTLFKKGAALGPSLAFLVASTNLVVELGIILWLLLGWRFMAAEWLGGIVMIAVLVPLSRLLVSRSVADAARRRDETGGGHDHAATALPGATSRERLHDRHALPTIAAAFAMDWRMLWKDLAIGFLVAGMLAAFVPAGVWQTLFLAHEHGALGFVAAALIGPAVAVLTFVCSIGNVPLAAALWAGGVPFAGVLAFLYADLIVMPLVDAYRRYFGWRMALTIAAILYVSMVVAALLVGGGFLLAGQTPPPRAGSSIVMTGFAFDHTFWLNLVALGLAAFLFAKSRGAVDHCHHHPRSDG